MTAAPDHSATEPLLDGRYLLHECVGEGGMARVYRADDLVLERTVAIKLMRAGTDSTATPERARREMTVLAGLNHPSLVTLYDARAFPDREDYLVMEFIDGPSLSARLAEGPMPAGELARIAGEIADALRVVHAAGIVHRDIKPSNVLLASTGVPGEPPRAKLADFGVAYLVDSTRHTTPGLVVGTGAYLAPEQVRGEPLTTAADIYALGLLMLEAVTGDRAFPHATGIGAILARLSASPEVPDWVGEPWRRLLRAMTASDALERPDAATVAVAARALPAISSPQTTAARTRDWAAATPTLPLEVPPVPEAPIAAGVPGTAVGHAPDLRARQRRRARPWIAAAAAATALIVIASGWWALSGAGGAVVPAPTVPAVTEPTPAPSAPAEPVDTVSEIPGDGPSVTEPAGSPGQTPGELVSERVPLGPETDKAQREQEKAEKKAAEDQKKAEKKAAEDQKRAEEKAQRDQEKAEKKAAEGKEKPGPGAGAAP